MNSSYVIMAIVVACTMSVGFVYAERSTIEVPFDFTGNSCTFDKEKVIYTCRWEGSSETIPSDQSEIGIIPPEQILEESKEAHEEAVAEKEKEARTPTEIKIASLEEGIKSGDISSADLILYDLLVDLKDSCELGIEHGALIQKYSEFELPTSDPRTAYKAINFKTNWQLGKIIMKIEECKGWDKYRVDVLGQRYLDIEKVGINNQVHHREMVQSLETYPHDRLDSTDFAKTQQTAKDLICENSLYHNSYKKQMGCFKVEELPESLGLPIRQSEAYKNYLEYMSSGYVDLDTLKKQEVKKAVQESLESFAQQHGIDIADLKNLVQSVDEYNESKLEGEKP